MDIGDICDYCEDRECELCIYGNPCLGCEEYSGHGICLSKGGCGKVKTEGENPYRTRYEVGEEHPVAYEIKAEGEG